MPDREYVIKCLKYLHDRETWKEGPLVYDDKAADRRQITANALALLREQEPIKHAKWEQDLFGTLWVCSACNMPTDVKSAPKYFKYCPFCGAKMI